MLRIVDVHLAPKRFEVNRGKTHKGHITREKKTTLGFTESVSVILKDTGLIFKGKSSAVHLASFEYRPRHR
ncbi:MAG: hypothetical protein JXD19_07955 [Deltaproteobacteria bacterium]|nr:hypothetical protein [Deltaproteobacteria bacterium]